MRKINSLNEPREKLDIRKFRKKGKKKSISINISCMSEVKLIKELESNEIPGPPPCTPLV